MTRNRLDPAFRVIVNEIYSVFASYIAETGGANRPPLSRAYLAVVLDLFNSEVASSFRPYSCALADDALTPTACIAAVPAPIAVAVE